MSAPGSVPTPGTTPGSVPGSVPGAGVRGLFGLPSLAALDEVGGLPRGVRIWLRVGPTDMRCGFDRLAALAREVTGQDPIGGHLFVFRNRRSDRLKILFWDRDGFVLFYKRLEAGQFKLPKVRPGDDDEEASIHLRPSELAMLLDGIDLASVKRSRRYDPGVLRRR